MDHWSWWRAIRLRWNDCELPDSVPVPVERMKEKIFPPPPLFLKVKEVLASVVYYCSKLGLTKVILSKICMILCIFYTHRQTDSLRPS
jgi:hypothetical protein